MATGPAWGLVESRGEGLVEGDPGAPEGRWTGAPPTPVGPKANNHPTSPLICPSFVENNCLLFFFWSASVFGLDRITLHSLVVPSMCNNISMKVALVGCSHNRSDICVFVIYLFLCSLACSFLVFGRPPRDDVRLLSLIFSVVSSGFHSSESLVVEGHQRPLAHHRRGPGRPRVRATPPRASTRGRRNRGPLLVPLGNQPATTSQTGADQHWKLVVSCWPFCVMTTQLCDGNIVL